MVSAPDHSDAVSRRARTLIALGAVLFLVGLLTGLVIPLFRNPRLGLSAHLEGVLNGLFLVALGAIWHHVRLPESLARLAVGLLVFGTWANWFFTALGAAFGTGRLTPIASGGMTGQPAQEQLVALGLVALSGAMIAGCGLLVYGLVRRT